MLSPAICINRHLDSEKASFSENLSAKVKMNECFKFNFIYVQCTTLPTPTRRQRLLSASPAGTK